VLLLVVVGCEPPATLEHPLSDAKTSRPDQELLGYWKQLDLDGPGDDAHPVPMTIGLSKKNSRLHEAVGIGLEDDRQVKVYRFQINTTVQEVDGSRTPLRFIVLFPWLQGILIRLRSKSRVTCYCVMKSRLVSD